MRIVSLSPSFTETLQALDLENSLVGITDFCPDEKSPGAVRIGSPKALKISEILALNPDFVLSDKKENRSAEITEIQKKCRVLSYEAKSIEAVKDSVWALGRQFGKTEEAGRMIENIKRECEISKKALESQPPVRTVVLLWHQPYVTVNFDTYISRLVESSGGLNVFREDPVREFPVEIEDMLDKEPEILLLAGDPFAFKKYHIKGFRKYRIFSKIRIELVNGKIFSNFGPRTAEAIAGLRALLIPSYVTHR
ncbi:MAG: ABC transporter substrate-binding protein [Candidatus Omnitrophica bacterium]|nr:ABC transporter substrate-binding protein [Candidatus Omnitrophota bacterium]